MSPDLPPVAVVDPADSVRQMWMSRIYQCVRDVYAGAPICKFPEDPRVYEHLLWAASPQIVIEIGAYGGGSALWFRDRLRTSPNEARAAGSAEDLRSTRLLYLDPVGYWSFDDSGMPALDKLRKRNRRKKNPKMNQIIK